MCNFFNPRPVSNDCLFGFVTRPLVDFCYEFVCFERSGAMLTHVSTDLL